MRYDIRPHSTDVGKRIHLTDTRSGASASIAPEQGGTVVQIVLAGPEGPLPLLAEDAPGEFARNPLFRGRVLFPFNDRIPEARYTFDGRTYTLAPNSDDGSAIHGFLYRMEMEEVERHADEERAAVTLRAHTGDANLSGYPFKLTIECTFRLTADRFRWDARVRNTGDAPAPFAMGWHPYFAAPGKAALQALYPQYVEVDGDLLPTGNVPATAGTPYDFSVPRPFKDTGLDMGFVAPPDGVTLLRCADRTVRIVQGGCFAYTQLYVPDDNASIAIEPISAATNAFNLPGLGLRVLVPGESASGFAEISLDTD